MKHKNNAPTKNKLPKPLRILLKSIVIAAAVLLVAFVAFSVFLAVETNRHSDTVISTEEPEEEEPTYIEFDKTEMKTPSAAPIPLTPFTAAFDGDAVKNVLAEKRGYTMAEYFCLDEALAQYNTAIIADRTNTDLLNSDGAIDADKLYETVLKNNEDAKHGTGDNRLNSFYSDAEPEEIRDICNLIAQVVNDTAADRDPEEMANILSHLKIFRHMTSTSLAAVTESVVFFFNPSMMSLSERLFEISGRKDENYDKDRNTFVHEIQHLKQLASGDGDPDNGMEAGFCRSYPDVTVDSLWDQWLLEAAAEMKMSEYQDTAPLTYAKKITYVNSYALTTVFDRRKQPDDLINTTFADGLEEAYERLCLPTEQEQRDFLTLMYAIQTGQYDCDDFWEYYEKQTGKHLTEDERAGLRLEIRADVIYDLTDRYYRALLGAIENGTVRDRETAFYLMKVWELDCGGHLAYTQLAALPHAEGCIRWQNDLHGAMFAALAAATGSTAEVVAEAYAAYRPFYSENGTDGANFRFYGLPDSKQAYIENCFNGYSITYFAENAFMMNYLDSTAE